MKTKALKLYRFVLLKGLVILLVTHFNLIYAQCNLGASAGTFAPVNGTTFLNITAYTPGTYINFPVLNGGSYGISTCGAAINTQITGWNALTTSTLFFNDDNGPLCTGIAASVDNYIPAFTNFISVQVSQFNCLPGGNSSITLMVRQNNNLQFTSSQNALCAGETRTLTATPSNVGSSPGGLGDPGTFSGTGVSGNVFTAPLVSSPTVFSILYTFGYVTQTQTLLVNPLPVIAGVASNTQVCAGQTVVISGSGADTYTWTGGVTNGLAFTPGGTSTYFASGTDTVTGCVATNTAMVTVSVNPLPLITANSTTPVICRGSTLALTASGADTYNWSGGVTNAVPFSPTITTNYTATGTSTLTGCVSNPVVLTIVVNQLPVISVVNTKTTLCVGETATLTAGGGAATFTWNGGSNNTVTITSPTATTIYSLSGTDPNGCANSTTYTLTVLKCVGISEQKNTNDNPVFIFPNPNAGEFVVESNQDSNIKIVDAMGRTILIMELNESNAYRYRVKDLATGIYYLNRNDKGVMLTQKISVNR